MGEKKPLSYAEIEDLLNEGAVNAFALDNPGLRHLSRDQIRARLGLVTKESQMDAKDACKFCGGKIADEETYEDALTIAFEHSCAIGEHEALLQVEKLVANFVSDCFLRDRTIYGSSTTLKTELLEKIRVLVKNAGAEREKAAKADGCRP